MANFENDSKNIIALSTLRILAYYHLLVHTIFKSMLFIATVIAGIVIHIIKNTQDIRLLGNLNEIIPFVIIRLMVSNKALSGVPFKSGFFRKDLIMEFLI
ncbi:PREDICTED: NADH-ubiquinone oxidoreductase chain 5-like [Trachymyrmex septentrionalis]|uniref:NADH-ubiquinone oxidoreductase chain 5-like n=1 Tax=Trachymyrmex septentrionalis TaxID=34720 RepID=UPI00084EDEF3|nr:PREDICTED: NADH-ubiquinone oxidoreductase chain 5-like [Trachymyrmex septentrionalis]